MTVVPKKLGVLACGDPYGYPFNALFSDTKRIVSVADFDDEVGCLVFWGGTDIHASLYGETPNKYNQNKDTKPSSRDAVEWTLMKRAITRGIPMIGVCRGMQMMTAMDGGKLVQHVDNHHSNHELITSDKQRILANSCHHQMALLNEVKLSKGETELLAWTPGISRVYLGEEDKPICSKLFKEPEVVAFHSMRALGIQGHPEWLGEKSDFVEYCLSMCEEHLF